MARNIHIKLALIDMLCITTDGRTMGGVRGAFIIIYLFVCYVRCTLLVATLHVHLSSYDDIF